MKDKLLNAMREASKRCKSFDDELGPKTKDIPGLMNIVSDTKNNREKRIRTAMLLTAFGL